MYAATAKSYTQSTIAPRARYGQRGPGRLRLAPERRSVALAVAKPLFSELRQPQLLATSSSLPPIPPQELVMRAKFLSGQVGKTVAAEVERLAADHSCVVPELRMAQPKSLKRINDKKIRGQAGVNDVIRGSLCFDDKRVLDKFAEILFKYSVLDRDYFSEPKRSGLVFRKLIMRMEVGNQELLFELQLHLKDFAQIAQSEYDHNLYELSQQLQESDSKAIYAAQQNMYCPLHKKYGLEVGPGHPCYMRV